MVCVSREPSVFVISIVACKSFCPDVGVEVIFVVRVVGISSAGGIEGAFGKCSGIHGIDSGAEAGISNRITKASRCGNDNGAKIIIGEITLIIEILRLETLCFSGGEGFGKA